MWRTRCRPATTPRIAARQPNRQTRRQAPPHWSRPSSFSPRSCGWRPGITACRSRPWSTTSPPPASTTSSSTTTSRWWIRMAGGSRSGGWLTTSCRSRVRLVEPERRSSVAAPGRGTARSSASTSVPIQERPGAKRSSARRSVGTPGAGGRASGARTAPARMNCAAARPMRRGIDSRWSRLGTLAAMPTTRSSESL